MKISTNIYLERFLVNIHNFGLFCGHLLLRYIHKWFPLYLWKFHWIIYPQICESTAAYDSMIRNIVAILKKIFSILKNFLRQHLYVWILSATGLTERQSLRNVVLQGDTWSSLLASIQVDNICKDIESYVQGQPPYGHAPPGG